MRDLRSLLALPSLRDFFAPAIRLSFLLLCLKIVMLLSFSKHFFPCMGITYPVTRNKNRAGTILSAHGSLVRSDARSTGGAWQLALINQKVTCKQRWCPKIKNSQKRGSKALKMTVSQSLITFNWHNVVS